MRFAAHLSRRWVSLATEHKLLHGALLYDATFTRILGTRNASEPILADLMAAWRAALTGQPADACAVASLEIMDRTVLGSALRSRGELTVDLRMQDAEEHMIVEVQHRAEALFPRRALVHSCADVVEQHVRSRAAMDPATDDAKAFRISPHLLRPVHSLAFCDYDFAPGAPYPRPALKAKSTGWRAPEFKREPDLALQIFRLRPCSEAMGRLGQREQAALSADFGARLSFVFALLPHAPPLKELTPATPPLLRWASLIAHVAPSNISDVPRDVRCGGVDQLLGLLSASADETRSEMLAEADLARSIAETVQDAEEVATAKGKAQGKAEGKAEGTLATLRLLGIQSAADYRSKMKSEPPPEVLAALSGSNAARL